MKELTPAEIVKELDRHIVGQKKAKRAVAIALRNRWRRQQVGSDLKEEIIPNNIIMIGPTGVGKTEIARRLADLAHAPFIKVEASKFTEVGYVGRDVESIIRDLTEVGVNMVRQEHASAVEEKAHSLAEDRLLDLLGAPQAQEETSVGSSAVTGPSIPTPEEVRRRLREQLRAGQLEARQVEVEVPRERLPVVEVFSPIVNLEEVGMNIQEIVSNMAQQSSQRKKLQVPDARRFLVQQETQKLIDMDRAVAEAIDRVGQSGIVFLDEIDKVATNHATAGPDISREGVQRDLLPIIEGSTVTTKYGSVNTDHILFVAAGAFHTAKPADLIPELQGRFPIRVELESLGTDEFIEILTRPESALVKQYTAMLETEGIELSFTPEAVREVARIASQVNESMENIGARRLHTVMSTLLDEILFDAPTLEDKTIRITKQYVREKLESILEDEDLSRYIL